ncbi:sensor histidine kinase [Aestuariivirga litoralis]|uniref:sensor histidine kinase n=1 Tax=Aestuariivirga litoralis TaxID=2650924 RepID=UPI0018C4695F|nr:PAS domain-containing sensor histidine kinase [Aestuariivirga litoralis]MBG1231770.1 PAS domain-containing protein [Aestuariivirga litoralis]
MLAVIGASNAPVVLLDGSLNIIAASTSFCDAFKIDPSTVPGKKFSSLGSGEWDNPQLNALLEATASGAADVDAYEFILNREGQDQRFLVLNARKLEYEDKGQTRLLLAAADVTEARATDKLKDNLLLEKAVLLSEVQHRVANSLQIIASILLQSARRVPNDETRGHLKDAHSRLMSIAAVQRQLAASTQGQVELRTYFAQLCKSLAASMIPDDQVLSIEVEVDDAVTSAKESVSLGLIVTELVINALKHAFPGNRTGKIVVDYKAKGEDWTLLVSDNGVGMPPASDNPKPGLGTNIVEALAKSLEAEVQVASANPGTAISIIHVQVAAAPVARIV